VGAVASCHRRACGKVSRGLCQGEAQIFSQIPIPAALSFLVLFSFCGKLYEKLQRVHSIASSLALYNKRMRRFTSCIQMVIRYELVHVICLCLQLNLLFGELVQAVWSCGALTASL
jgi:hypothetical protein